MTRETRSTSISILADTRRSVAVALAALALLGAVAAAGTATAQNSQPTVVVTDGTTAPDGTTTVGVVLTDAPDGLAGYYLELTVGNPSVARIDAASYPDQYGLTSEPVIGDDGATAVLEAADVEGAVEPGATDVTLATVTVAGAAPGEVELTVTPQQFDADDGSAFTPATAAGTIAVSGAGDAPSADAADGDGASANGSDTDETGADGADTDTDADTESTEGDGPLSPVLVLVAIALLVATGLRRRN
jgi:MYXO-CTERM domain-containing protein